MFVEHKELGEAVPVKVGTLKLSEAIRIGAKLRPQCRNILYNGRASCAIGAALEATGFDLRATNHMQSKEFIYRLRELFPALVTGEDVNGLFSDIGGRNDSGHTREEIADWLETQGF